MNKLLSRICSLIVVFSMLMHLAPINAFAAETQSGVTTSNNTTASTEDAYILEEIVENRTEYSKEYLLSNGLHLAAANPRGNTTGNYHALYC